jgi:hypothetical protein
VSMERNGCSAVVVLVLDGSSKGGRISKRYNLLRTVTSIRRLRAHSADSDT